jgi:hypothetical protein
MQHQSIAPGAARRLDRLGLLRNEPSAAGLRPPRLPRATGGLSGRPTCRIYARGDVWILEIDCASGGWLFGHGNAGRSLVFPKLAAAIGYAERYGLDYWIERPRQHQCMRRSKPGSGRLPRSWLARLAHNGRKGDIYHG